MGRQNMTSGDNLWHFLLPAMIDGHIAIEVDGLSMSNKERFARSNVRRKPYV